MERHLIAVVAQGGRGRVFLPPNAFDATAVTSVEPPWRPTGRNPEKLTGGTVYVYGLDEWWKLFTSRQLVALTTFSDLLAEVANKISGEAVVAGLANDGVRLRDGGSEADAYADAVVTYLSLGITRLADMCNALCRWESSRTQVRNLFGRQAIPMVWDFAENNVFSSAGGDYRISLGSVVRALERLPAAVAGSAEQRDARARMRESAGAMLSTDPPYYDNISYADLSDFFYVWLRRNLADIWPDECSTLLTPKSEELIANRYRAGSKLEAEEHFESGMAEFMQEVADAGASPSPATIYYAYKATEAQDGEIRTTGWDTFLQAVLDAGLQVTATWPMRTELGNRLVASGTNALASSIVLACRPRLGSAVMATRGEFIAALRTELPEAVRILQSGNIAPVDMAQSTIGPGIKVFSRYAKVVEADGSAMRVSAALSIINDVLGEVLDGEEAELDRDTRFALTWFAEHQYEPGSSGDAESVAKAKNTSLEGLTESGIGEARVGKFRLYQRSELDPDWSPAEDDRFTIWEALQYLVAALERSESEAADLLHTLGGNGDRARQLAYLLYQKADDKGWAAEANAYNSLITAWPGLREGALAAAARVAAPVAGQMF